MFVSWRCRHNCIQNTLEIFKGPVAHDLLCCILSKSGKLNVGWILILTLIFPGEVPVVVCSRLLKFSDKLGPDVSHGLCKDSPPLE